MRITTRFTNWYRRYNQENWKNRRETTKHEDAEAAFLAGWVTAHKIGYGEGYANGHQAGFKIGSMDK